MNSEIEKYEKERNQIETENLNNKVKIYGKKMKEQLINKNNNKEENNETTEGNNKRRKHHNYYVVDEKKIKPKEKGNIERVMTNCKRKSVLDKEEERKKLEEENKKKEMENKKEKEKNEIKIKNKIVIKSSNNNTNKYMPPPVEMITRINKRNEKPNIKENQKNQNIEEKNK
jgi:hypothetical protein